MIRVILPTHLRTMAHVGSEVTLEAVVLQPRPGHAPLGAGCAWLTESATRYPMLRGAFLKQSAATATRNSAGRSWFWPAPVRMRRRPLPRVARRPTSRRCCIRQGAVYRDRGHRGWI